MLLQTIPEGLGLGALLVLVCAVGIHKGAVGMAHLYDSKVQERCVALGLTTKEKIKQNSLRFKLICVPGYLAYVLICVYAINGAQTFWGGFWQCFVILSVMNLIDRLGIDGYWVGHTKCEIETMVYAHGTHFAFPEGMLKTMMPVGSGLFVQLAFQAAKKYPKECRQTRIDIEKRMCRILAEWKREK